MGIPKEGILVPLVTPFDDNEEVRLSSFRKNLQWFLSKPIHGIVVLPTAGEAPSLTLDERKLLVTATMELVAKRVPVLVGVGGLNIRETEALVKHSESVGADGLFLITPYFYRLTPREYIAYFQRVARSTRLEVLIYNSTYAGTPLTLELLGELTLEPNFVALKEGNQLQLGAVVRQLGSRISVFTARDMYIYETIAVGGHGAIAYSANIAPDLVLALFSAAKDGNFSLARKLQFDLIPLVLRLVSRSYPAAIKAAMNIVGLEGGTVRAPLTPLTLAEIEDLRTTLRELQSTVSPIIVGAEQRGLRLS